MVSQYDAVKNNSKYECYKESTKNHPHISEYILNRNHLISTIHYQYY